MMEVDKMISDINNADEMEILEFDFDPIFNKLITQRERIQELEKKLACLVGDSVRRIQGCPRIEISGNDRQYVAISDAIKALSQ